MRGRDVTLADILAGGQDATDEAKAFRLDGAALHPFSGWRHRLADSLGLKFFRAFVAAADNPEVRADLKNGSYPGVDKDTALVAWLVSHSREEIGWAADPFASQRAFDEIDRWADEREIFMGGRGYEEAGEISLRILFAVLEALEEGGDLEPPKKGEAPKKKVLSPTG